LWILLLIIFVPQNLCQRGASLLTFVLLLFVTYSAAPARCEPHRLLSFGASRTGFTYSATYCSSHTRLCQLADFPSLILRWLFADCSVE